MTWLSRLFFRQLLPLVILLPSPGLRAIARAVDALSPDHPVRVWYQQLHDPQALRRLRAAHGLHSYDPADAAAERVLINMLSDRDFNVRIAAIDAISEFRVRPARTLPAIIRALETPDDTVCEHATQAIVRLGAGQPAIVADFIDSAWSSRPHRHSSTSPRAYLTYAVNKIGDPVVATILGRRLKAPRALRDYERFFIDSGPSAMESAMEILLRGLTSAWHGKLAL